jgi:hypothetical protein
VVEPSGDALRRLLEGVVGYLTVDGYREMFIEAGFGEAVERAESGADSGDLVEALPGEAAQIVGLVGPRSEIGDRLQAYADAGLDEVAVLPVTTDDPYGERTLRSLRSLG